MIITGVSEKQSAGSKVRKFRGMREGQFCENAGNVSLLLLLSCTSLRLMVILFSAYYIFFQAQDGAFEAVPVSEW
jgi:hypothetical protein